MCPTDFLTRVEKQFKWRKIQLVFSIQMAFKKKWPKETVILSSRKKIREATRRASCLIRKISRRHHWVFSYVPLAGS